MGLKKKSKVSAEFSMSSLTDIIFLLLIFFMLTSSLVSPNALILKLPGSSKSSTTTSSSVPDVTIRRDGSYRLNGKSITTANLEKTLIAYKRKKSKADITISPDQNAPVEAMVTVMDIALKLEINAILAIEEDD